MAPKPKRGRPRVARNVEVIKSLTLDTSVMRRIRAHGKALAFEGNGGDVSDQAAIRDLLETGLKAVKR